MAHCTCRKRNRSIFKAIINRQIYGANVLQDIRMIRTMIEDGRTFKKVHEISSKSPVVYQGDRLYINSFGTCYDLTCVKVRPRIVYSLPRRPSRHKIEEMLVFECPLDQTTFCKVQGTFYANGPYSVGITADNYLKIFDFETGEKLKQVYLFPGCKFKYLHWETDLERLVVQSTQLPQNSTAHVMPHVPEQTNQVLLYIAIFNATPLEFVCMLPISHKIFGTDVCNASVRNGILIIMYRRQKLQFFSLEDILKNHTIPLKLGDNLKPGNKLCLPGIDESASGVVGIAPLGLPVNVTLLEKPCVLFEVVSSHHDLSLGGYPWHYIANIDQVFHVRMVNDHSLAENGILKNDDVSFGTEKAFFHSDLSGRVLFITPSYLCCLKFGASSTDLGNKTHKLQEQFILNYRPPTTFSINVRTKSGRKVKQVLKSNLIYQVMEIIQDFDYDDELDLLVVLYLNPTRRGEGIIGFYDNQTGKHVQSLSIDDIEEQHQHSIAINRNILVIISKQLYNFRCLVYHLDSKTI